MALPKIDVPIQKINIPSLGKEVEFRTFTVKEKILLIAQESKEAKQIAVAVKQIINNCCLDKSINVNKLALVDLEYLFLQLRAYSINDNAKITIDPEDEKEYIINIDLKKIKVKFSEEEVSNTVKINDDITVKLRYPNASILDKTTDFKTNQDTVNFFVIESIAEVYHGDELTIMDEETDKDKIEFVDSIPSEPYELIKAFINTIPTLDYTVSYKNSKGNTNELHFNSLNDFFTYA